MEYRHSIRDVMNIASEKTGVPGWQAHTWESVTGGDMVRGCVPSGVYAKGPNKGRPKFRPATPGTERTVVVTKAELNAMAEAYEREHGKCWECKGSCKTVASIHVDHGTTYRPCAKCKGAGVPSNVVSSNH